MDADLVAAVRKRQVADALANGNGDPDPDPEVQDQPDSIFETESRQYVGTQLDPRFETESRQYVGTGPEVPQARSNANDQYLSDYLTGAPPAQATESDYPALAQAQTPGGEQAIELPALTVSAMAPGVPVSMASRELPEPPEGYGVAPRAELVDPDPDAQYLSSADTDPEVRKGILVGRAIKRAQLEDPDPDSLYLPPGLEDHPDAQRAALIGRAIKRAALVDPDPDQAYLDAAQSLENPPAPTQPIVSGQVQPPVARTNPNDQYLSDYLKPPAPPAGAAVTTTTAPTNAAATTPEPKLDYQSTGVDKGRNGYRPTYIVLHSTDGASTQGDLNTFTDPNGKVGVHYLIGRDGKTYHLASEGDAARQAGYDKFGNYANDWTIGIEQSHVDRDPEKGIAGEVWSDATIRSAAKTAADVMRRYPWITPDHVIFHSDLAGERKHDPADYPMQKFYGYLQDALGLERTPVQKVDYSVPQKGQPTTQVPVDANGVQQPSVQATGNGQSLAQAAASNVGMDTSGIAETSGGHLACAAAVSTIVHNQLGYDLPYTTSTAELYDELRSKGWREVDPNTPGAIIVSPTQSGVIGHTGIVGQNGLVYSNSSARTQWEQNYTVDSWQNYFGSRGLETHAFVPPGGEVAPEVPGAPRAQPSTKLATGFYQNEDPRTFDSGKATTFATKEDVASGQDSGVGAPRLGRLDTTQTAGIAVPRDVMQAMFGNNPVLWRKARADVVDPVSGRRLRLPIVDFGPRADTSALIDMTPWVSSYFGGDKNLSVKLVPNAGQDPVKNPQSWLDEQASIKAGVDSSELVPGATKIVGQTNFILGQALTPAQIAQANAANAPIAQKQVGILQALPEAQGGSLPDLIRRLDQPVQGVSPGLQKAFQTQVKAEATKYAQANYGIKDPAEAFNRIMQPAGPLEYGAQLVKSAGGYMLSMLSSFNANLAARDEDSVRKMLSLVNPNASPEQISNTMQGLTNPDLSHADRERLIRDEVMVPYSQLDQAHQSTFDLAGSIEALRG